MDFHYSIYGLTFRSNLPLPGLVSITPREAPDVDVVLGKHTAEFQSNDEPWFVSSYYENSSPILTVWKSADQSQYRFLYSDKTEFVVDNKGRHLSAIWPSNLDLQNAATYLLGQISAFILRLRGVVCLHSSSVEFDGAAIAILGDSGAGKSTTAAAFIQHGARVLSEDLSPLLLRDNAFFIQPGYPRINLWPDVVNSFHGSPDALPQITPTWNKRYLDLQTFDRFSSSPVKLGAVYVLQDRSPDASKPVIQPLTPSEAFVALLTNAHGRHLLEKEMRINEFRFLSDLATRLPVRSVTPLADIGRCSELCEELLRDFKTLARNPIVLPK